MKRGLGPILVCALLGMNAAAQVGDKQQTPPVFSSETQIVNVVVSVHDKAGLPVSDLKAEDFVVFDEGKARKLELFARSADSDESEAALEPGEGAAARDRLVLDLGLLLDTSESMKQQIRLAQEAAVRFLEAIPRARDLLVLFFDHDIRVSRYDSEHQQGVFERILDSQGTGTTALYDAIAVYLSRVEASSGRRVLVVFTDGQDTVSDLTLSQLRNLVKASGVTIYPVSFADSLSSSDRAQAKSFLLGLAELSGGRVFDPKASRDLASVFQSILDELAAQYVLGFAPEAGAPEGKYRKLRVEVHRPDVKVRHRPGYYSGGLPASKD